MTAGKQLELGPLKTRASRRALAMPLPVVNAVGSPLNPVLIK